MALGLVALLSFEPLLHPGLNQRVELVRSGPELETETRDVIEVAFEEPPGDGEIAGEVSLRGGELSAVGLLQLPVFGPQNGRCHAPAS